MRSLPKYLYNKEGNTVQKKGVIYRNLYKEDILLPLGALRKASREEVTFGI